MSFTLREIPFWAVLGLALLGMAPAIATAQRRDHPPVLRFLESHSVHEAAVGLTEPSGLTIDPEKGQFWTVSDDRRQLYRLDLAGNVAGIGPEISGLHDAEGIARDPVGQRLLILSEKDAAILSLPFGETVPTQAVPLAEMAGAEKLTAFLPGGPAPCRPKVLSSIPSPARSSRPMNAPRAL